MGNKSTPPREQILEAVRSGLVMDGVEEPASPPDAATRRPGTTAWENYTEFPPVLAIRLRPAG
jgi:hypothetical protein